MISGFRSSVAHVDSFYGVVSGDSPTSGTLRFFLFLLNELLVMILL